MLSTLPRHAHRVLFIAPFVLIIALCCPVMRSAAQTTSNGLRFRMTFRIQGGSPAPGFNGQCCAWITDPEEIYAETDVLPFETLGGNSFSLRAAALRVVRYRPTHYHDAANSACCMSQEIPSATASLDLGVQLRMRYDHGTAEVDRFTFLLPLRPDLGWTWVVPICDKDCNVLMYSNPIYNEQLSFRLFRLIHEGQFQDNVGWHVTDWEAAGGGSIARKTWNYSGDVTDPNTMAICSYQEEITFEILGDPPSVESITQDRREVFLEDVSLPVRITATINWRDAPQENRRVTFAVNGTERDATSLNGTTATMDYNVADDFSAGSNVIRVTAHSLHGVSTPLLHTAIPVVTVPPWAGDAQLFLVAAGTGDAEYSRTKAIRWPDPPFEPKEVFQAPFFKDRPLGLVPTTFDFDLSAVSTGAKRSAPIKVNTGVRFGKMSMLPEAPITAPNQKADASLNASGLHVTGTVSALDGPRTASLGDMIIELFPSLNATSASGLAARAITYIICKLLRIEIERISDMSLSGGFREQGDMLQWEPGAQGKANLSLRVTKPIDVIPRAGFMIIGTGTISIEFTMPPLAVKKKASVNFKGCVYAIFESWRYCPVDITFSLLQHESGADAESPALMVPESDPAAVATDTRLTARPSIAASREGWIACAWNDHEYRDGRLLGGDIAMRFLSDTLWSPPLLVTDDEWYDHDPAIAFDRAGRTVVVWETNHSRHAPQSIDSLDSFLPGIDLAYAVIDPYTRQIVARGTLAGSPGEDRRPRLVASDDGTLTCAWERCRDTTQEGGSWKSDILIAHWDGLAWDSTTTAVRDAIGVVDWAVAARSRDTAMIAVSMDRDGNFNTGGDGDVFLANCAPGQWSALRALTADTTLDHRVTAVYASDGTPLIAWLRNNRPVVRAGVDAGAATAVFPDSVGPDAVWSDLHLVRTEAGCALSWSENNRVLEASADPRDLTSFASPAAIMESTLPLYNLASQDIPGGGRLIGTTGIRSISQSELSMCDVLVHTTRPPSRADAIRLIAPQHGSTIDVTQPLLTWSAGGGTGRFDIHVSTDPQFGTSVMDVLDYADTSIAVSGLAAGRLYHWRVRRHDPSRNTPWSAVWSFSTSTTNWTPAAPPVPSLHQLHVYPNPCRSSCIVAFRAGHAARVDVRIMDIYGRMVGAAAECEMLPGDNRLSLDVSALPSGTYLCRALCEGEVVIRSFLVAR